MVPLEKDPWCKEEAHQVDLATKIILTSMHKEYREKNKGTEYKRNDPMNNLLLNQWLYWFIITIVIHPYKGKLSWWKTTHASL